MLSRSIATFVVLLASLAMGCHSRDPFALTQRRMQHLLTQASSETQCPAVALTSERVSDRVFRVSGCGRYVDFAGFTRGRGRYSSARWVRVVPITERAPVELGCPAASTTFMQTTPLAYTASGCGRLGAFELRCGDVDCGWLLVSSSGASPMPAPSVVPAPPSTVVVASDPSAGLRAGLDAARAGVLACSSGQPVTMHLAWDASAHVTIALDPPFGGTTVETCAAAAIAGAITSMPTTPGAISVTVR